MDSYDKQLWLDYNSLSRFVQEGRHVKLIEEWSYYGKTNNHSQFVTAILDINELFSHLLKASTSPDTNTNDDLNDADDEIAARKDTGSFFEAAFKQLASKILDSSSIKYVYRSLNQQKTNITIPMLHILTAIVNNNKCINIFINQFDLNINFLPKLLNKLDNVAKEFGKFWLNLQSKLSYFDRKSYFNHKIWLNLFKVIPLLDSNTDKDDELLSLITSFINDKILHELNFKKFTKLKFVNESCLFNLLKKLDHPLVQNLLNKIIDPTYGILFKGDLPSVSSSSATTIPTIPSITVNNHSFKLRNKTLYNLLTFIKIDCVTRINFVVLVLSKDYSLINPYMHYLLVNGSGYNDPNLSNWYIQHTLLYIDILKLPMHDNINTILLKPLNKSSLLKGIQSKSPLIVQLNITMVYLIFQNLHKVDVLSIKLALKNLPSISELLEVVDSHGNCESITLLVLKLIKEISNYQVLLNNSLIKYVNDNMQNLTNAEFSKANLIRLNYFVSIQLNLNSKFELKSNNKIIISLIKFSNFNDNYILYYSMINKLLVNSLIFACTSNTSYDILNPIWSLVYLHFPDQLGDVLLETIHRSNNPYKYIDLPFNIHPFIKIFLEQFRIYLRKMPDPDGEIIKWLERFLQSFVILGESATDLLKLVDYYQIPCKPDFNFTDFKSFKPSDDDTLAEIVFKLSPKSLSNQFIKNDYEFLCVFKRLQLLMAQSDLTEANVIMCFEMLANYFNNNPNFLTHLNNPKVFCDFLPKENLTTNGKLVLRLLNKLLSEVSFQPTQEIQNMIANKLKDSDPDSSNELVQFNWLLSNDLLNSSEYTAYVRLFNYSHLLFSRNTIPSVTIDELLKLPGNNNLKFLVIRQKLTPENLRDYLPIIIDQKLFELLSEVKLNQECIDYLSSHLKNTDEQDQWTILSYIQSQLDLSNLFPSSSFPLFKQSSVPFKNYLSLLHNFMIHKLKNSEIDVVEQFIDDLLSNLSDYKQTFCKQFIQLLVKCGYSKGDWLNKSMIHITETFATSTTELQDDFHDYLLEYLKLFPLMLVPSSIIDTQLEVLLNSKWVNTKFISYFTSLIVSTDKLDYVKLLPIFINNPKNVLNELPTESNKLLRIESALIVWHLFNLNPKENITIGSTLVDWYLGSIRFEDLLIKKMLIEIESITQVSWLNKIKYWEINELNSADFELIGEQPLIKNNELISINKCFISNCLKSNLHFQLPDSKDHLSMVEYINQNLFKVSYQYMETVYDYEFLMLLMINNEELFNVGKDHVNVKLLLENNFLSLLIKHLNWSGPGFTYSKIILNYVLKKIDNDESFKDKNLFRIYISSILNSCRDEQSQGSLTNIQLMIYSSMIPILTNPGHSLYELVYKYVLSTPRIRAMELPLFKQTKVANIKIIEWYLLHFVNLTGQDLRILNVNQFFEWIMNLLNLPHIKNHHKLLKLVLKIIFTLPDIDNGSISLITKYGILSFLEQLSSRDASFNHNLIEISTKLGITHSKRSIEWSNYDLLNSTKRLKR